jgi:hypothetical protein
MLGSVPLRHGVATGAHDEFRYYGLIAINRVPDYAPNVLSPDYGGDQNNANLIISCHGSDGRPAAGRLRSSRS